MGNSPEELIELAKASFPHPILLLTSSDNGRLWEKSTTSQPLLCRGRFKSHARGMKFRGPGWEIHLQEVEGEVFDLHFDFDCHFLDGSLVATWDDESLKRQGGVW